MPVRKCVTALAKFLINSRNILDISGKKAGRLSETEERRKREKIPRTGPKLRLSEIILLLKTSECWLVVLERNRRYVEIPTKMKLSKSVTFKKTQIKILKTGVRFNYLARDDIWKGVEQSTSGIV